MRGPSGEVFAKEAKQPRWVGRVDLELALQASARFLSFWLQVAPHSQIPAFSGGLFDTWPGVLADALTVARTEWEAIARWNDFRRQAREE